jgi:hypothetical protein
MKRRWMRDRSGALLLVASALCSGCGSTPEGEVAPPSTTEIAGSFDVMASFGRGTADVRAGFTVTRPDRALDVQRDGHVSVDGVSLPSDDEAHRVHQNVDGYQFRGTIAAVEPGAAYTFTLDLPWQAGIELSVPSPAPVTLVGPPPGTKVSTHSSLQVRWEPAAVGARDWIRIAGADSDEELNFLAVEEGQTTVTVSSADLNFAATRGHPMGDELPVDVAVVRWAEGTSAPTFAMGRVSSVIEVARVRVILTP